MEKEIDCSLNNTLRVHLTKKNKSKNKYTFTKNQLTIILVIFLIILISFTVRIVLLVRSLNKEKVEHNKLLINYNKISGELFQFTQSYNNRHAEEFEKKKLDLDSRVKELEKKYDECRTKLNMYIGDFGIDSPFR